MMLLDPIHYNHISDITDIYTPIDSKYKPNKKDEYTILAAIIATNNLESRSFTASLATGTKCIGIEQRRNDTEGLLLNDSHAEVLAKRGFQRYLWKTLKRIELQKLSTSQSPESHSTCTCSNNQTKHKNPVLDDGGNEIFEIFNGSDNNSRIKLKSNWSLEFFITDSPCGDSSIYDLSNRNSSNYSKAQFTGAKILKAPIYLNNEHDNENDSWVREVNNQQLGCLRTKSGRSDLPSTHRTISKSCTDKLCKWLALGIQGDLLSYYFEPLYISKVIIWQDPNTNCKMEQILSFERGIHNRVKSIQSTSATSKNLECTDVSNNLTSVNSDNDDNGVALPVIEIIDGKNMYYSMNGNIGKAWSHYSCNCETSVTSSTNLAIISTLELDNSKKRKFDQNTLNKSNYNDSYSNDTIPKESFGEMKISTTNIINNNEKVKKLRPCSISINWIRNVPMYVKSSCGESISSQSQKNMPSILDMVEEKSKKNLIEIQNGTLEIIQAHDGVLQGSTKANIKKGICSSRLCRKNMAKLAQTQLESRASIPDPTNQTTFSINHHEVFVYKDWKNKYKNIEYATKFQNFKNTSTFSAWDFTSMS